jgi:hypothetical protein
MASLVKVRHNTCDVPVTFFKLLSVVDIPYVVGRGLISTMDILQFHFLPSRKHVRKENEPKRSSSTFYV